MSFDVVVFGAHPDDAEMGMGGTVARLVRDGHSVIIVSLTRGESGTFGTPDERAREAAAAAKILGCSHRLLDFSDASIVSDLESRQRIMHLIRDMRPRIVFAPYYQSTMGHHDGAAHVDHLATGRIVRDAIKLARLRGVEREIAAHDVGRLYYYMVPRNVHPTLLVDVTDDYETLVRAIRAYASQMAIERQGTRILEILQTHRRYFGIAAACKYAEPFWCEEALRPDTAALFTL